MSFLNKHKKTLIVLLIILALLGTITFTVGRSTTLGENFLGTVTKPFTTAFNSVGNFFGNLGGGKDKQALQDEVDGLRRDIIGMDELSKENERLKELLDYQESNTDYQYKSVSVTSRSSNYWFNTFTVSGGMSSGITEGMPVVSSEGLVGKVSEVGATWSRVTSIIDSSSTVSALVERTRDNGTVKSKLDTKAGSYQLTLEHLPADSGVQPGDVIVTSGLGGTYPKGILIGTVSEVEQATDGTKLVVIKPASDFLRLENVSIMTYKSTTNILG